MQVCQIKIQNQASGTRNQAPFVGSSIVVVVSQDETSATLLHPWSMEVWEMPLHNKLDDRDQVTREGLTESRQELFWVSGSAPNTTVEKLLATLRRKLEEAVIFKRTVPLNELSAVLAEFQGLDVAKVRQNLLQKLPHQEEKMDKRKAASKKATATKKEKAAVAPKVDAKFVATDKMDMDKNVPRGQGRIVAETLKRRTVPATLADIAESVKGSGKDYKLKPGIELVDSVRYHLNKFVADGLVAAS